MSFEDETISAGGLDELLHRSQRAEQYFDSLPKDVQDRIMQHRETIDTEVELKRYGNRYTGGDGIVKR